jgi:hypothetical protein
MNENEQDLMISSQTQGKTTNPMDNQQETKEKILRVKTGALSVLSYPPAQSNS